MNFLFLVIGFFVGWISALIYYNRRRIPAIEVKKSEKPTRHPGYDALAESILRTQKEFKERDAIVAELFTSSGGLQAPTPFCWAIIKNRAEKVCNGRETKYSFDYFGYSVEVYSKDDEAGKFRFNIFKKVV